MKRKNSAKLVAAIAAVSGFISSQQLVHAGTNGTWIGPSGGLWSTPADWATGAGIGIAQGQDGIATFGTGGGTVNLDTDIVGGIGTIGTLKFNGGTWVLANNSTAANILTLSTSTGQPTVDVVGGTTTISLSLAGTQGFQKIDSGGLALSGANTGLSGTVNLLRGDVTDSNNNAFGSSNIVINPGSSVNTRIILTSGVTLANSITMTTSNAGGGTNGTIISNGAFNATVSGSITINGPALAGGHFVGSTGTNFLTLSGPIVDTLPENFVAGGAGNGIVVRAGNVILSGGGSYFRIDDRNGTMQVGAINGIATNAVVDIGGNGSATLDLNGFNQTITGITNLVQPTLQNDVRIVTNSSTTTPATLTLAPLASTDPFYANLSFGGLAAATGSSQTIQDASASAPLSIAINGAASGKQIFAGTANTYHGTTTITSGTLAVAALALGGAPSSIGQSSSAASNLVFGGGTLQYTGGNISTDRNFTINAGTTGTINVSTASSTLTMSGGSAATSGSFIKSGPGTLVLTGSNLHTGTTTVSGGSLIVDGSLTSGSAVSIASGATLGGDALGNIAGTVTPAVGGIIAPGDPGVIGTLNVGTLNLNTGSIVNFEFSTTPANDKILATNANLNGGSLDLYQVGTTTAFTTPGTYTLFSISNLASGSFGNLSIANPQAGISYSLSNAGVLTIGTAPISTWTGTFDNVWSDSNTNWSPTGVPSSQSATVQFSGGGPTSISLSGPEMVGAMIFSGANYSISGSSLTLDNGSAAAPIKVSGQQAIASAISLNSALAVTTTTSTDALTLSGPISGAKTLSVAGPGTVTLTANNSYANTTVLGGTLNVGAFGGSSTTGSLGTGNLSLASGTTLNFNLVSPASYSFPGGIAGPGIVNQLGTGSTTVGGAISGTTTVNVSAGTLTASSTLDQSGGVNVTGSGSLTVSGGITGAGALTVNTTGTASVGGTSTYSGGTTLTTGKLILTGANAFPANSSLAVNAGVLDLHSNSISLSNITDATTSTGVITNSIASTVSTVAFSGNVASYDMYAALNDGSGKVALSTNIANSTSGNNFVLRLHSPGTYTGGTTIGSQSIEADVTGALGTGPINILLNNLSINTSHVQLIGGVTLSNAVNVAQGNPGAFGIISATAATGNATYNGTITFNADNINGGTFSGPTQAATYLLANGPIIAAGTATTASSFAGNVQINNLSATPSVYSTFAVNGGTTTIAAVNGILPTAVLAANTGGVFDLNGYSQTVAGIQGGGTIEYPATGLLNQGAETSPVLTVNTSNTAFPDSAPDTFTGTIGSGVGDFMALTKTGLGTLVLTGAANAYQGNTTITQGVLAASTLATAGNAGGIGFSGAVNPGFNVIFNGGAAGSTLRYTGASASTNQTFAIANDSGNNPSTAIVDVSNSTTALTWTGAVTSSSPSSNFTKAGAGTLIIDSSATWAYSGNTTVSNGALIVNGTAGTTGVGTISVAGGAVLGGTGFINGSLTHTAGIITGATVGTAGTLNFTGPLTLHGGTARYDINTALLTLGAGLSSPQDLINAGGGLSITGSSIIDLEFSGTTPSNGSTFTYELFSYTGTPVTTAQANLLQFTTNLGRGSSFTPVLASGEVNVNVVVGSGGANLTWASTSSSVWDIQTTPNWTGGSPNTFFQGDNVTFADGAGLQTSITLNTSTPVLPGAVLVNSNTNNYSISGTGSIGGTGALTKTGNSTLSLYTTNTYNGGTNINGGVLSLGNNFALGTGGSLGPGTISFGGGTLQYSAFATAVDYSPQISTAASQAINVDTNGQSVTWAANLSSTGGSLTKSGGGTLTASGNNNLATITQNAGTLALSGNNNLTGNLVVNGGTLSIPAPTTALVNSIAGTINLNGGTLSFSAPSNIGTGTINFNGGALGGATGSSATALITNPLVVTTLGGTLSNNANAFFSGTITGAGTLNSSTTNADVLTGAESSSGGTLTIVSNAQVNLVGNGTGSSTPSTSPTVAYVANAANGNAFVVGSGTPGPNDAGLLQLGSLSGVAGSAIRDANTAGVGPATFQIGALNTSTTFAGNIVDNANGNNTTAPTNIVNIVKVGTGTLTLSGTGSYTGTTTVSQGILAFATVNTGVGARTLSGGLTIASGAEVTVAASTPVSGGNPNRTVLATSTLANSGTIDLSSNDMVVHSGATPATAESVFGTFNAVGSLSQQVAQGRGANGAWTGTGASGAFIESSAAAASPSTMALAIVINDTNQSGSGSLSGVPLVAAASPFNSGKTTFDGQTVADGDVLVKYTYYGDALLTGRVIAADYIQIDNGFNSAGALKGWYNGDFNYDGVINGDDYTLIDNAFNTQGSVSFAGVSAGPAEMIAGNTDQIAGASSSSVPEPATLSLLTIGAAGMLSRRRRRS
jgi:fibronectin-binding autotransporter adhesin